MRGLTAWAAVEVIWEAIDVVWKGMLGIFVITAIIIFCVFLLGKIPNRKK